MPYTSPQAVIDEVESQVVRDFEARGNRLIPLSQSDLDNAVAKAQSLFAGIAHRELDLSVRLHRKVSKKEVYLDHVQVSKDLLDAINSRRSSSKKE